MVSCDFVRLLGTIGDSQSLRYLDIAPHTVLTVSIALTTPNANLDFDRSRWACYFIWDGRIAFQGNLLYIHVHTRVPTSHHYFSLIVSARIIRVDLDGDIAETRLLP